MKRKILRKTRIVTILSALVVFLTVYSLVLPAVTLTDDAATEDPGINTSETTNVAEVEKLSSNEETSGDVEIETTEQAKEDVQKEEIKEEKTIIENVSYPAVSFSDSLGDMIVYVEAPEGAFPENTRMQLKEVEDEAALVDSINSNLENKEVKAIKAVDITFIYNNEEFEPLKPIKVSMTSSFIESNKEDEQLLVHVDNDNNANIVETTEVKEKDVEAINNVEEVQTLVENTDEINEITTDNTVAFESDAFSVYAVVYTVDFEYEGYTYSINGGSSILLSELFDVLNIEDQIENAENVTFSNPDLVGVEKIGDDWTINSLKAFSSQESLIVLFPNKQISIIVTDAPVSEGTWDLSDTSITQFLHASAEASVLENEQERDAAFQLNFTYSLTEDTVREIDQYDGEPTLVYDLTSLVNNSPIGSIRDNINGSITIGTRKLGFYRVENGIVTLHFTDPSYFDGRTTFTGFFKLTVETSETELGSLDEYTYSFPGTTDVIPIHYKKTVEDGSKGVYNTKNDDGSYTLHYSANINVNTDLDTLIFNDILGGLQTLDASSVKINGTTVSVSQSGQRFSFDVGSALGTTGVSKGSYQVTYNTTVTEDQLKEMSSDKTTETNTATWKVNGDKDVPGGETSVEIEKPKEPIPVVKTISSTSNQPGDTITYTVTYGKETTALSGFQISDYMTDVVIPQGEVELSFNGQTQIIEFNSQITDQNYSKGLAPLFDYTFPEGTAGNGPVTVTYTVKLIDAETASKNGIYDETVVSNTAREHRQNTTDTKSTTVTYEKEPHYTVVKAVSSDSPDGNWAPGTILSYTLTIGDSETNMAGVNIKDLMSDQQILNGDIMIKVGEANQVRLVDYVNDSVKWSDDGVYSDNQVELFNFNMPSNAGNGPVVITYQTKIISQEQASANNLYGEHNISNTGYGGNDSNGTSGVGVFGDYPIKKSVSQDGTNKNGQEVEMGSTLHYTLTFGDSSMNLAGVLIYDEMTDLQKLSSSVKIKKADGTSFDMPLASGMWSEDGVVWNYFDDESYSTSLVRVFNYRLPSDIGNGPITIEYDVQIISEEETNNSGIQGLKDAFNTFKVNNYSSQTDVKIPFPEDPEHNPQVKKEFDHWDVDNSKIYWNIIVEKEDNSAYPLENVTVRESTDTSAVVFKSESQGIYYYAAKASDFDLVHAVVTTDSGVVLTPGVDYMIDKDNAMFVFPVLNERVHIKLAYNSTVNIIDGTFMHNAVRLNNGKEATADATYNTPEINMVKNGAYTESDRLIKWEVLINPSKKEFADSDPVKVLFTDTIPRGLTLVNYDDPTDQSNPSIHVGYSGVISGFEQTLPVTLEQQTNKIREIDIAGHGVWGSNEVGLNKETLTVTYYTLLSQEEWDRITSSSSGSEDLINSANITAGDGQTFTAYDTVTITSDGYLNKEDTTAESGGIVVDELTGENSKSITYRIEINPNGYTLNSGNVLSLTDYISTNMDIDTSSVSLTNAVMGSDGKLIPQEGKPDGINVSYNDDSRLLSLTNIPDKTPLLLTYTCFARAQGEDTFKNTATLIGGGSHSDSTNEKHKIQTDSAGVLVDGIIMNMHKIDENNIGKNLQNAKFQLYECELEIGELTNSDTYTQTWWNDLLAKVDRRTAGNATQEEIEYIDSNFKIVNYKPLFDPITTGASGFTQWPPLSEHKLYAWKEIEAPANYTGNEEYHYFVGYQHLDVNVDFPPNPPLPENEQLNRKHAAWALDDATQFANGITVASMANLTTWTATNVESKFTSITATKVWENDNDNLFETRPTEGIKLQLIRINADGSETNIGPKISINVDDNGDWPSYIWNRLPAKDDNGNVLKYKVVEDKVDNYSTTYSDSGNGVSSGEIIINNRLIPKSTNIYVRKVFNIPDGDSKPENIKVSLMEIRIDKNNVASDPVETDYEEMLNEGNNWTASFTKLDTTKVIDDEPYTLKYTVREDASELEREGFHYIATYSDNGTGVIETTENDPLVITNAKETGKITIRKVFGGVDNLDDLKALQDGLSISVTGKDAGGSGNNTLTLGWNDVKDGYTISGLPINETYEVLESIDAETVLAKYSVSSETVSSGTAVATFEGETVELKNIYEEKPSTGSLKITKSVTLNGEPTTSELTDGTYTFEIWNAEGTSKISTKADGSTAIGTLSIVITKGNSAPVELTVDGLQAGTYLVKEVSSNNEYMVIDTTADGYDTNLGGILVTVTAGDESGIDTASFINNYETTDVSVRKVWDDNKDEDELRPEKLTLVLMQNGEPMEDKKIELSGPEWRGTISDLPKYSNGEEIDYHWLEDEMPSGYFLTNSSKDGLVTTLTNSLSSYDLTTSYVGVKNWSDNSNIYGTRPEKLIVTLYADDTLLEDVEPRWVKDQDQWTYIFDTLPVFSEDGEIIHYRAEETVPGSYSPSIVVEPTVGEIGTITYENGADRLTPDNHIIWTLGSLVDLSFVAIKPTANGDVVVWTHRHPLPSEVTAITNAIKNGALPGCQNRNIVFYSGTGDVATPHGTVHVTYDAEKMEVTLDFGSTDVWSQFIVGQFNKNDSSSYDPGTTTFTNTLDTVNLNGSKTWNTSASDYEDPILKLARSTTTIVDGVEHTTIEEVRDKDGNDLQPVWSGEGNNRAYTYSGLPKTDKQGNVYTYSVSEYQFKVDGVTYTVTKDSNGNYIATPDSEHAADERKFNVTQSGNDIVNTEVTDFEFSKIWKDTSDNDVEWLEGMSITVTINAYTTDPNTGVLDDQTLTFSATDVPDNWSKNVSADSKKTTFKTSGLVAIKDGDTLTYYVKETQVEGYKAPSYADQDGNPLINVDKALNGQQIINAPEDGIEFPSTGGPGTVLIKLLGATVMFAVIATLIERKRQIYMKKRN